MKATILFFALFAGTFGGGCGGASYSVNPLYSATNVKTRNELVGTWVKLEDPRWKNPHEERMEITKTSDEGVYRAKEGTDGRGVPTETTFRLVEIGDSLYADVLMPPEWTVHGPPVHLFFLVKIKGDYIGISTVDLPKLTARLKADPIPYETKTAGSILLTAKTDELQRFFRDAGEELFLFDTNHEVFHRLKPESTKAK